MRYTERHNEILRILGSEPGISISRILELFRSEVSIPTLNRDLAFLVEQGALLRYGKGRTTRYNPAEGAMLLNEGLAETYFNREIDNRHAQPEFNPEIFKTLKHVDIFSAKENSLLEQLQKEHAKRIKNISPALFKKEVERLTIELSWKSSQIEGNTYSLLETELLFTDRIPAPGKSKFDALMLLNHKTALGYIYSGRISMKHLKISSIEGLHSLLIKDLGVSKNLRRRPVGITGTIYRPPDNEFQVREFLEKTCTLINQKKNVFEKSMLAVLFISYIQPFEDGNKRTGRILGNAVLIKNGYCPLSYRSVTPVDYKKAMILFYEQNNITAYKKLFMEQYEFAVRNYF